MYRTLKNVNWPQLELEMLALWKEEKTFQLSVDARRDAPAFTFFEGPPSANGMPGIHHVMSRALKDIFCRYKTQQGFRVARRAGWDTHGLPIELQVEKRLGITKEDIGKSISIADYNRECRQDVMQFKDVWDELTERIGFWLDLNDPYITYEDRYIETLWNLLRRLYDKGFLYKGYTIQPFSPAAGTGLSSHELNQPGTYKQVKDTTVVAQFKLEGKEDEYLLAWTTTPWTLPSNTGLAVGADIEYARVATYNLYTGKPVTVVLASALLGRWFDPAGTEADPAAWKTGDKVVPWKVLGYVKGKELEGLRYEQLLPYAQPEEGDNFRVVCGDFVSTEDGTGIVHLAPSFGSDDFRTGKLKNLGSLTLVDKQGRFTAEVSDFAGEYVKEAYLSDEQKELARVAQGRDKYLSVDERISIKLKQENKAFRVEKYEHSYPHCWRTDKPILYYPLESWFIRTTAVKDRMVELNRSINWKPKATGEGRFGNWLENLVDWNLSRSRYWGTPLPIWRSKDGSDERCIGSMQELREACDAAVAAGLMASNPMDSDGFELHRPWVDDIVLAGKNGEALYRESDLIDVWFDSGAMPYAQWHYPFENAGVFRENFPADFIAEGVDQTRGWFFTLHALAVMLEDSVAYRNVVANGLVLDKNGNKMSKRLGNAVDPFATVKQYGADALRWYMISNAPPWDNLKFDLEGVEEVQRKFFGTLYNTYSFFSLYAGLDHYVYIPERAIPLAERPELDRWVVSKCNSLILTVTQAFDDYDPTRAARAIEDFTSEQLSNWYVRLSRRRFWKGEMQEDKQAAYDTLFECLRVISQLMAPVSPFFSDWLYRSLTSPASAGITDSVHLSNFPVSQPQNIDSELEETMQVAQDLCSMVLSIRKKEKIRVRQPLSRIMVPIANEQFRQRLKHVESLILSEVNVKELHYLEEDNEVLVKTLRLNFKALGPRAGAQMKAIQEKAKYLTQSDIRTLEKEGKIALQLADGDFELMLGETEILAQDIPGWQVAVNGNLTVALDITLNDALLSEGRARDLVNRIQNMRKDQGFQVTDRIRIEWQADEAFAAVIAAHADYICAEVLAEEILQCDDPALDFFDIDGLRVGLRLALAPSPATN
ncbi:MAG: isoleucine--tRNA ligase [Bacteroidota bacterium]